MVLGGPSAESGSVTVTSNNDSGHARSAGELLILVGVAWLILRWLT